LHSLCSYQGKLKPGLAHWLVRSFARPGDLIVDPLGGVGTVAFEAALLGHQVISNDKSILAAVVAGGKLNPPSHADALDALHRILGAMKDVRLSEPDYDAATFGLNACVRDYYHPDTLSEVLRARRVFLETHRWEPAETFVWASLLHILHGNRPYALSRTSHPITPFHPSGPSVYRSLAENLRQRIDRALAEPLPDSFRPGESLHGDYRSLARLHGSVDLIITSPPFLGMRFDRPNWLRLWFCGWAAADFSATNGGYLEREQLRSRDCYADFFDTCRAALTADGLLIIHVGSGGRGDLTGDLRKLAAAKFNLVGEVVERVSHVERHGLTDKGRTTAHHLLFLK
jgi:hypothetical protein